jgi:hypothetical protein
MLAITAGSFVFMLLLTAAVSVPHKALDYKRADLLTVICYGTMIALAFLIDPLRGTVGKNDLYVALSGVAALMIYIGLKIEQATRHVIFAVLVTPVLAALVTPTLCLIALAADATNYIPPRPPPRLLVKAVHALARRHKA